MKYAFPLFLLLSVTFSACSGDSDRSSKESKISLTNITGDLESGRVRSGIKIRGDHFNEDTQVSLLTEAGSKLSDLLETSVSAQEIEAKLPEDI